MKTIRVTYTTSAAYAPVNMANIEQVMSDLCELSQPGIFYQVFLNPDGQTFVHQASFRTDEDNNALLQLPSFRSFQQQLRDSMPEVQPKQEFVTLVGASRNIFQD
jgi:hypothetical protein